MRIRSALRIGLLPEELSGRISAVGNAAGSGAIRAMLSIDEYSVACETAKRIKYVELSADPLFADCYTDNMFLIDDHLVSLKIARNYKNIKYFNTLELRVYYHERGLLWFMKRVLTSIKAIEAVKHYRNATQVSAMFIDDTGETLFSTNSDTDFCSFCFELEPDTPPGMKCRNAHLYGSYQAERFGGKYVFFCPYGMAHWACPITIDGIMKGALLGGPVHMIEPEEFLLEELFRKYENNDLVSKAISLSKKIPIVSTNKVNSLCELLSIVAFYLSDTTWYQYGLNLQEQEQAADISDYIHKLKRITANDEEVLAYSLEKEKELQHAIAIGDKKLSQKLLNEILGHIYFASRE